MRRYVYAGPWKTRYEVHWISPDGRDCLLAGSNSLDGAVKLGMEQADRIFDSPFETDERKYKFLEQMYIADMRIEDAIDTALDSYVDELMSELNSRINLANRRTTASTRLSASKILNNGKIQKGLLWDSGGHVMEVVSVSPDGRTCKITESWISEDTGDEIEETRTYNIDSDSNGEYAYDTKYKEYANPGSDNYDWWARDYAVGAMNYPYEFEEQYDDYEKEDYFDDRYTSSTAGDYSPSNPWDAPGMSVRDFI